MSDSTTPGTPEVAYNTDAEAAQALLSRWNVQPDEGRDEDSAAELPEAETTPDDTRSEQADEATADDEGEQTEQDAEDADDSIEIDFTGEKIKLPAAAKAAAEAIQRKAKELEAGVTRKFQEVAERDKSLQADRERLEVMGRLAAQHLDLAAQHRAVAAQLAAYDNVDWNALADQDPVQHGKALAQARTLERNEARLREQLNQTVGALDAARKDEFGQKVQRTREFAQKIRGWTPDLDVQLSEYTKSQGFDSEAVSSLVTHPKLYELAVKAYQFDKLQAAKPQVTKRANEAPKPAVKTTAATSIQSAQKAKEADAMTRLKRSGNVNDAAAALLAKMRKARN